MVDINTDALYSEAFQKVKDISVAAVGDSTTQYYSLQHYLSLFELIRIFEKLPSSSMPNCKAMRQKIVHNCFAITPIELKQLIDNISASHDTEQAIFSSVLYKKYRAYGDGKNYAFRSLELLQISGNANILYVKEVINAWYATKLLEVCRALKNCETDSDARRKQCLVVILLEIYTQLKENVDSQALLAKVGIQISDVIRQARIPVFHSSDLSISLDLILVSVDNHGRNELCPGATQYIVNGLPSYIGKLTAFLSSFPSPNVLFTFAENSFKDDKLDDNKKKQIALPTASPLQVAQVQIQKNLKRAELEQKQSELIASLLYSSELTSEKELMQSIGVLQMKRQALSLEQSQLVGVKAQLSAMNMQPQNVLEHKLQQTVQLEETATTSLPVQALSSAEALTKLTKIIATTLPTNSSYQSLIDKKRQLEDKIKESAPKILKSSHQDDDQVPPNSGMGGGPS